MKLNTFHREVIISPITEQIKTVAFLDASFQTYCQLILEEIS